MYAPHTVTIYNVAQVTDKDTFQSTEAIYATVLRGVMLQASKAANVRKTGLEGADAVDLFIPFSVDAVDGTTGAAKKYVGPQEFFAADDRSRIWTLSVNGNGGKTVFVKGEYVTDKLTAVLARDDSYTLTKVDRMDYGSSDMQHFECGGV